MTFSQIGLAFKNAKKVNSKIVIIVLYFNFSFNIIVGYRLILGSIILATVYL